MDVNLALLRLKNMVAWDCSPCLSEEDLTALLMYVRRADVQRREWTDPNWIPTFDLNWAAREAWAWKAGAAADGYKIISDGVELDRHQIFEHCTRMFKVYDQKCVTRPQSVRSRGNLVEDRGTFDPVPWWYLVSGSQ